MKRTSLIISGLLTLFVFTMSALPGSTSGGMSLQITEFFLSIIDRIAPANNIDVDSMNIIIRKTAHVCEYMVLGVSWYFTIKYWKLSYLTLLFIGIAIASLDETIQIFSVDRGPSILDALVFDFLPFAIITLIFTMLHNSRVGKEDVMSTSALARLADNKISTDTAYDELFNEVKHKRIRFIKRAHFIKLKVVIPDQRGLNVFLRVLFFLPFPIFIIKIVARFLKWEPDEDFPFDKNEMINLISTRGIKVKVNAKSGEKVIVKTL